VLFRSSFLKKRGGALKIVYKANFEKHIIFERFAEP